MLSTAIVLVFVTGTIAEDLPKVAATKLPPPKTVAPELAKTLGATSYSITSPEGKEIANLWIRDSIPVGGMEEVPPYNAMQEGTLVGVLEIKSDELTDFRDQELPTGVFTMRLGIQPSDGNHMGVAPFPEFLCLSPVEKDKTLEPLEHDALMELSKEVAGTGHPTVMFMMPFFEKPADPFPFVNNNELEHIVVNIVTKGDRDGTAIDFPIGIIIVGTTTAE
jgi:hypothetical protein